MHNNSLRYSTFKSIIDKKIYLAVIPFNLIEEKLNLLIRVVITLNGYCIASPLRDFMGRNRQGTWLIKIQYCTKYFISICTSFVPSLTVKGGFRRRGWRESYTWFA